MRIIEDLHYGEHESNVLDIYLPEGESSPVFVFFHGGGLENGCYKDDRWDNIGKYLCQRGITYVSAEYRKYPEAEYPDFIEDGAAAASWVIENISQYIKPEGIFLGGSSAGAYITQMLCFDEKYLGRHGLSNSDISGYYHDAGQPTTHFKVLLERGIDSGRVIVDEAAPMYHIDGTKKYSHMKFVVADNDMPNRFEQTMLMMSVLRNFGYNMSRITCQVKEGFDHCGYNGEKDEAGAPVTGKEIADFIWGIIS